MKWRTFLLLLCWINWCDAGTIVLDRTKLEVPIGMQCSIQSQPDINKTELQAVKKSLSKRIGLAPDLWHKVSCDLYNTSDLELQYTLHFHNAQLDTVYFVMQYGDGTSYTSPITGCNMPYYNRPTNNRTLSLPLYLKPNVNCKLSMYVYGREFEIAISPTLINPVYNDDLLTIDYAYLVLFLLILLSLLIAYLVLLMLKWHNYDSFSARWFMAYGLGGLFHLVATSGFGSLYVWGSYPWLEVNAALFTGGICSIALMALARKYYLTKQKYPFFDKYLVALSYLYFIVTLYGFLHYFPWFPKGSYMPLIAVVYILMFFALLYINLISFTGFYEKFARGNAIIALFFLFHTLFYISITCLENNIVTYSTELHNAINLLCYVPQILFALSYIIIQYFELDRLRNIEESMLRKKLVVQLHQNVSEPLSKIELKAHHIIGSLRDDDKTALQKILSDTQLAKNQLDDLFNSVNADVYRFNDLIIYIKSWMEEFWSMTPMQIDVKSQKIDWVSQNVDPLVYTQIMLIVKEINNNIAKYAKATVIEVCFEQVGTDNYKISIKDNGIGFDTSMVKYGHGIEGMHYRMQHILGKAELTSVVNKGTSIALTGPYHL